MTEINTVKNRSNLYMELDSLDLVTKLKPLLEKQGYILSPEDGKFVPRQVATAWEVPWVYVQADPNARCDIYHRVFYNVLDHIHSFCRQCWKVVVRPQNLIQLFDLYEIQREMAVPSKCGLEFRKTVPGLYGGYFYTRSREQGEARYKEVRRLVDERLGTDVPVILKRYCTEFECGGEAVSGKGPSDETPEGVTPEEREMEEYIETHFPRVASSTPMPKHLKAYVMRKWIHHAAEHGDQTYLFFTNGEKLFPSYVTYNPEMGGNDYGSDPQ